MRQNALAKISRKSQNLRKLRVIAKQEEPLETMKKTTVLCKEARANIFKRIWVFYNREQLHLGLEYKSQEAYKELNFINKVTSSGSEKPNLG